MNIGFLVNHYTPHQAYHSVPIAFALSTQYPQAQVTIIAGTSEIFDLCSQLAKYWPKHRCRIILANVPKWFDALDKMTQNYVFLRKEAVLHFNQNIFKDLDVLVVPEKHSLKLKRYSNLDHLKFVRIRHGAGDRTTGLDETNLAFDLILASGQKMKDRLLDLKAMDEKKISIIGYPKFDVVKHKPAPKTLFANDNPTILYNPHFRISESSWVSMGKDILDFFKENNQYNLIFAPHILLYKRKKRHKAISLDRYQGIENIHLDTGSVSSVDMTYTRLADVYLGDVSSQIYEFLGYKPRPCLFLNTHNIENWRDNPAYLHWSCGSVVEDMLNFHHALDETLGSHADYLDQQKQIIDYTFALSDSAASSELAAQAIIEYFNPDMEKSKPS